MLLGGKKASKKSPKCYLQSWLRKVQHWKGRSDTFVSGYFASKLVRISSPGILIFSIYLRNRLPKQTQSEQKEKGADFSFLFVFRIFHRHCELPKDFYRLEDSEICILWMEQHNVCTGVLGAPSSCFPFREGVGWTLTSNFCSDTVQQRFGGLRWEFGMENELYLFENRLAALRTGVNLFRTRWLRDWWWSKTCKNVSRKI